MDKAYKYTLTRAGTEPPPFTRGFLKCAGLACHSSLYFVILSAAKNLSPGMTQILRCAQNDTSHLLPFQKHLLVKGKRCPGPSRNK